MSKPFLSPRNDAVFKMLFGDGRNIDILTDFLKSALRLPAEDYEEVTIVDPHLSRESFDDKQGTLDVKVKTPSGKVIDIEIQVANRPWMRERIVFYLSRMVTEQIDEGDGYLVIKRAICILIADYVLIGENDDYHNRYTLHDSRTGSEFTDLLEVNTLELPKLPKGGDGTALWDWLAFLNARNEEELTMLADKNPQVKKAVAKLAVLSADEQTRLLAESREKLQHDIDAWVYVAEEKGREEGREEGRKDAQLAMARSLLARGMAIEEIQKITTLSQKDIQSLLH